MHKEDCDKYNIDAFLNYSIDKFIQKNYEDFQFKNNNIERNIINKVNNVK